MAITNQLTQQIQKYKEINRGYAVKNKINQMISGKDGGKFITSLISLVSNNPAIAECEHSTILSSALLGESLKLSPSPQLGQFYIVPFRDNNNERIVATFQIGYKGYIQLAMRSGYYRDIDVMEIREGEYLGRDKFTGKPVIEFIEDEEERENLPIIGYFAYFELLNGFKKTLYWSKVKMVNHATEYSKSYIKDIKKGTKYSFWAKDFDGMAYKTMLRQLISKWGIMSVDFQTALTNDMALINENNEPEFVDNVPEEEHLLTTEERADLIIEAEKKE